MTALLPRSAWTTEPVPSGRDMLEAAEVRGIAVHWAGDPVSTAAAKGDKDAVADWLRGVWHDHTARKGHSDIDYQRAVDNAGRRWDLRGYRAQSGANGKAKGESAPNRQYGAVCAVLGKGQSPTAAMFDALREEVADFRRHYPRALEVVRHGDVRPGGSECPGPDLGRAVTTGALLPRSPQEDDMPLNPEDKAWIEARMLAHREHALANLRQTLGVQINMLLDDETKVSTAVANGTAALRAELGPLAGGGPVTDEQLERALRRALAQLGAAEGGVKS